MNKPVLTARTVSVIEVFIAKTSSDDSDECIQSFVSNFDATLTDKYPAANVMVSSNARGGKTINIEVFFEDIGDDEDEDDYDSVEAAENEIKDEIEALYEREIEHFDYVGGIESEEDEEDESDDTDVIEESFRVKCDCMGSTGFYLDKNKLTINFENQDSVSFDVHPLYANYIQKAIVYMSEFDLVRYVLSLYSFKSEVDKRNAPRNNAKLRSRDADMIYVQISFNSKINTEFEAMDLCDALHNSIKAHHESSLVKVEYVPNRVTSIDIDVKLEYINRNYEDEFAYQEEYYSLARHKESVLELYIAELENFKCLN